MNVTIIWTARALNQLAEVWTAAEDQQGVTEASYRIEAQIRANPLGAGESRDEDERIVIDPPLRVLYHVDQARQVVHVTAVGPSRRPW
jgi:plasmid stabilization system protein ParE